MDDTFSVIVKKHETNGLGFSIKKRENKPFVVIDEIFESNKGENFEKIQNGDVILSVNDIDFEEISYKTAIEILSCIRTGCIVKIVFKSMKNKTSDTNQTTFQRFKKSFIKNDTARSLESQDLSTLRLDTIDYEDDKVAGYFSPAQIFRKIKSFDMFYQFKSAFNNSDSKSVPDDFSSLIKTEEILNSTFGSMEVENTSDQRLSALKTSDNRFDENIVCKKVSCKNLK
jgi:hypothetical protein